MHRFGWLHGSPAHGASPSTFLFLSTYSSLTQQILTKHSAKSQASGWRFLQKVSSLVTVSCFLFVVTHSWFNSSKSFPPSPLLPWRAVSLSPSDIKHLAEDLLFTLDGFELMSFNRCNHSHIIYKRRWVVFFPKMCISCRVSYCVGQHCPILNASEVTCSACQTE